MTTTDKEAALGAFARLLKPLMRVALAYGISAPDLISVTRRVYIEALEARLREQKRPPTDARLAIVAGLSKSEVAQVREAFRNGALHGTKSSATLDQITNLLTVWHTDSRFSGAYGIAMDLDLVRTAGSPRKSFEELVSEACPGVDQEALLDDLVASCTVEVIDGIAVRCLFRTYVPRSAEITQIDRMGRILSAVAASLVHNLLDTEGPAFVERTVVSDHPLSERGRNEFLAVARERGQALLAELDTFLTRLSAQEESPTGKRYGLGIYFFEDQASELALPSNRIDFADSTVPRRSLDSGARSATAVPTEIDVLAVRRDK